MAFYGYWSGSEYKINSSQDYPEIYDQLWQGIRYTLPQIQGFEFELRDLQESYAILSKQAIALGRNDLLDETLAGVKRVNALMADWTKLNQIINAYSGDWPNFWYQTMGADDYVWRRSTNMDSRTIAGIFFTTSHAALEYVKDFWSPLRTQWSTEQYSLRQLEKKFTPAEIVVTPEPYIPIPYTPAPVQTYVAPIPTYTTPAYVAPTPEYISPEDSMTWYFEPTPTQSITPQIQVQEAGFLSGIPTWAIALIAGAGVFMFLGRGNGEPKR